MRSAAAQVGVPGELGRGKIQQGYLEGSNVNVVEELVDMIECQRAYEINSKMVSAVDEMLKKDRKSTRLNSSHIPLSRMPSSA